MEFPPVTFSSSIGEARRGRDSRQLSRDFAAGRIVRLRRGVYLPTDAWLAGTPANRYALTTASLAVNGPPPVLCRETALMAWGLELRSVPSHVRYRTSRRSAVGSTPVGGLYGDPSSAASLYSELRPGAGRLPQGFPGCSPLRSGCLASYAACPSAWSQPSRGAARRGTDRHPAPASFPRFSHSGRWDPGWSLRRSIRAAKQRGPRRLDGWVGFCRRATTDDCGRRFRRSPFGIRRGVVQPRAHA